MAWVAVIGGAVTLGSAAIKADAASNAPGTVGNGGGLPSYSNPSAATYGTSIGNDGWAINFGSGNQTANPTKRTTDSYVTPPPASNPLGVGGQYAGDFAPVAAGLDVQTLLLLGLGGLVLVKALRK